MAYIPSDPAILFSYLNTLLRDRYPSLSALSEDLDLDEEELLLKMKAAGYGYDAGKNCFSGI